MFAPSTTGLRYRADIDGLRAIAVVSVVAHHLSAKLVPGGFVGVDIFFVISGFLISRQIIQETDAGTFSFRRFYQRRMNRILPALVTVVGASLAAGVFLVTPSDLVRLAASAVASITGLSNIFFWRRYGNYFGGNSSEAILLHTWSLGVEEQFYVVWPLMLFIFARLVSGTRHRVLCALVVIGLVLSEYGTRSFASASYYLLPTRFFELAIGGVLATLSAQPRNQLASSVAGYVGLLLIAGSLVVLSPSSPFPGWRAMIPCLGAGLLVWSGGGGHHLRLLSSRPLVFLGLISYSLYLWHWPIIAYLTYTGVEIGFLLGALVAGLSILLAWLTWKHVETPFRRRGGAVAFRRVLFRRLVVPATVALFIAACCAYFDGFPERFSPVVAALEKSVASRPEKLRKGCHVPTALYRTEPSDDCRLGAKKESVDGILLGDSFANHFTGMIDVLAAEDGLAIMDYTMDACPPILGYSPKSASGYRQKCLLRNERAFALLAETPFKLVLLAGRWPDTEEVGPAIEFTLRKALSTGAQVVVILKNQPIPAAASCPIRRLMLSSFDDCSTEQSPVPAYWQRVRDRLPSVQFIDPNDFICRNGRCAPVIDNLLFYRDRNHLNDVGSRRLGSMFVERRKTLIGPDVSH